MLNAVLLEEGSAVREVVVAYPQIVKHPHWHIALQGSFLREELAHLMQD